MKAELEKAESDAKISDIHADAESKKISKLGEAKTETLINKLNKVRESLVRNGVLDSEIDEIIKTLFMSENGNTAFFVGGNDMAKNIGAGVAAGKNYTANANKNSSQAKKLVILRNF